MSFETDGGGFAFKANDAKLQANASTWATKLSQLKKMEGVVRIVTYSLPTIDYVKKQLGRRPKDIVLIANSKFEGQARQIRNTFPGVKVAVRDDVHSKVLLIEPKTIVISSANFGGSTWHETSVSFQRLSGKLRRN